MHPYSKSRGAFLSTRGEEVCHFTIKQCKEDLGFLASNEITTPLLKSCYHIYHMLMNGTLRTDFVISHIQSGWTWSHLNCDIVAYNLIPICFELM